MTPNTSDAPHGSSLRCGRTSMPEHTYFVTKCLLNRQEAILSRPEFARILIEAILWAQEAGHWRVLGFAIMPDHYHLIVSVIGARPLSDIMGSVTKFSARKINSALGRQGSLWQDGFYDHGIRCEDDLAEVLSYVHANPVRKGLVGSADEWQYSTANPSYAWLMEQM